MPYYQATARVTLTTGDIVLAGEYIETTEPMKHDGLRRLRGAPIGGVITMITGPGITASRGDLPASWPPRAPWQVAAKARHPGLDAWYDGALSVWRWDPEQARKIEPVVIAAFEAEQRLIAEGRAQFAAQALASPRSRLRRLLAA